MQPPPAAAAAAELDLDLLQAESVNAPAALDRIRAAEPDHVVVCAFGQLIKEPLLSEHRDAQRASVAASPLARGRADRASDHRGRPGDRSLRDAGDRGPRLRAGGAAGEHPD